MVSLPAAPPGAVPRHEAADPRFASLVLANAALEPLLQGARWLEGPVWFADHGLLLVSDIPNDRILRVTEAGEVSVYRQPAGYANGHARDREGRLVGCSHGRRCIERTALDGRVETLVDHYRGKRLNAPNDIVVKRDGSIWFTDPHYGIETNYEGVKQAPELPPAVYCFDPATGELRCVADDFDGPNGLAFSPDERLLYVAESGTQFAPEPKRHIRAFDVAADGRSLMSGRVFHTVTPGYADGFRCDEEGNLWSSASDGVHCIAPSGELLGRIYTPHAVSNLCFGGRLMSRLFLCCGDTLYALSINRRAAPWP
ncbi:MAG: SMP-30/gluconolactonase/LRE family protein [Pseudomonadota bacterium]|nr:SMP-30/gluconolactonase/LRE family protein [Pseudomonadota bacterium]